MNIICPHCKKKADRPTGYVNRAKKLGVPIYCSRVCSGLARRVNRTEAERKEIKRLYDLKRSKDVVIRTYRMFQALDYNSSPAGRAMQKRNREKFKQLHLEYCRTPEYRKRKKSYDFEFRAKKKYGEFWECLDPLLKIEEITCPEKYEIRKQNGTFNKSQKRKRLWNSLQQTLKRHYGTP